jgi:hypothetical protein
MSLVAKRLAELGIELPHPAAPLANYVGFVRRMPADRKARRACRDGW